MTPVLVLDQFEEIFTLGQGAPSAETLDELGALIENRPKESLRWALDDDPTAATRYDFAKESCRVILALREDFLPDFEGLRRQMPSIMENRMRLTRMDGRQARDAILASGGHLVAPGVAEQVIAFVAAGRGRSEGEPSGRQSWQGSKSSRLFSASSAASSTISAFASARHKSPRICWKARSRRSSGSSTS